MRVATGDLLRNWARIQPQAVAVIDGQSGQSISYSELDRQSDRIAWALYRAGVRPGSVVGYVMRDSIRVVILLYAVGKLGAAWTPLNPHMRAGDWERQLLHSGAGTVVADGTDPMASVAVQNCRRIAWTDLDLGDSAHPFPLAVSSRDRAGILYTSGTTGVPKGAWHTHETLWGWNYSLLASVGITRDDRILNPYPLFHMGGIGFTLAALQTGASVVLETPFDASHLVCSARRWGGTLALMVPTMVQALLDLSYEERHGLGESALRHVVTTSAPLLSETRREMARAWPLMPVSVLYSATEAIFSLMRHEERTAPLCVGRPVFGSEIIVLDDSRRPCPAGVPGTVYVRGLSAFSGYHGAPDQFEAWWDEWITCFDYGYMDDDGYLYLVDREKDLINSGGEKISSLVIENALRTHPNIREVGVVGIPDRYWGEAIHAVVVPKGPGLTAEDVKAFARIHLPAYQVPKTVVFQQSLPKTSTGKVLKRELRERSQTVARE